MKKTLISIALVTTVLMTGVAESPSAGGLITPEKAKALLESDSSVVLLDVRTADEYNSGHIANALLLPFDEITSASAAAHIPSKTTPVVVYCRSGRRSAFAAETLRGLGYKTVYDLGGIFSWPYGTVK